LKKPESEQEPVQVPQNVVKPPTAAVARVKKSHKGCAVVWLTDVEVLERSILQQVAVVDGVCVEIRRHTKASSVEEVEQDDTAPVGAVFVAWGARVERRVCVTEEGLEAYFNSLQGLPRPEGLVPESPFVECFSSFDISSSAASVAGTSMLPFQYPAFEEPGAKKLLHSNFCKKESIEALWAAKDRLDAHWDRCPPPLGRSLLLRVARAQLFPSSGDGGKEHENRAGDKLQELADEVGLFDGVPPDSAFLDLCGGPGAWSQMLLANSEKRFRGFGFTLRTDTGAAEDWHAEDKDQWYPDLLERSDWTALWGADGSGDLLKPGNIEHCAWQLSSHCVCLCVADGGFSDEGIPAHQQELYTYRLLLGELLMAASCLQPGGRFVCKLYSTFSDHMAGLLYATTCLFSSVRVVKPKSSRATGPERYLVAFGFRGHHFQDVYQALYTSQMVGGGQSPLKAPLLTPLLPKETLVADATFAASMRSMTTSLCQRQSSALSAVVDQADHLEELALGDGDHGEVHFVSAAPRQEKEKSGSRRFHKPARGGA